MNHFFYFLVDFLELNHNCLQRVILTNSNKKKKATDKWHLG